MSGHSLKEVSVAKIQTKVCIQESVQNDSWNNSEDKFSSGSCYAKNTQKQTKNCETYNALFSMQFL